jgi:hypothetical protein
MRPDIRYHGIRALNNRFDRDYIGGHPPHPDDRIVTSYDEFYAECSTHTSTDLYLMIDCAYYVTQK